MIIVIIAIMTASRHDDIEKIRIGIAILCTIGKLPVVLTELRWA